ncbi:histidine phosphatase family protein [Betaproteobacteria bacterium]|nr:histidine phosphatase family protein [Betaproteobacteria bacterium]GHU25359.1 histidine phosphatase family protein [Betaproteobacteria bacterium]
MELLLWRHADALSGASDIARELSPLGQIQAQEVASWLETHAPADLRLVVSPAVRTRQTVSCFCGDETRLQFCAPLFDGATPEAILEIIAWPDAPMPVLIVGHQPLLGAIAAHLLGNAPFPPSFRKGALWWLRGEPGQNAAQLVHVVEAQTHQGR